MKTKHKYRIYTGTYSCPIVSGTGELIPGRGTGISCLTVGEDGREILTEGVTPAPNPSFLAVGPDGRTLFAVHEISTYEGEDSGAVSAWRMEADGSLTFLNQMSTRGADPCHLAFAPSGDFMVVSNYTGGSVSVYRISENGLEAHWGFAQHTGSGPVKERQGEAHAHSALFLADGSFWSVDLGMDRLIRYRILPEGGIEACETGSCACTPGSGPRMGVRHTGNGNLYQVNELACSVSVWEPAGDGWREKQCVGTLRDNGEGSTGAHIRISESGRYLYVSNRGENTIVCFRIGEDGRLEAPRWWDCGGKTPRFFTILGEDALLLAGNQESDEIAAFAIDGEGGLMLVNRVGSPCPVCISEGIRR